jgi:DNA topoisomerase IB
MAKWRTLVHNGVALPPPYQPKGLSIKIRGETFKLDPLQEEMAYAWALKKDTPYVKDPVFCNNFLQDFLKTFNVRFDGVKLDEIDFSVVFEYVERERALKADKEYRKKLSAERKKVREELKARYGWAEMDGKKFEVANWMVEPPGIFMGRGQHPLRGRWKPRVYEEDIVLNLGEDAPIPPGNWKQIVHDHDSMWLARWEDKLTKKEKYVWLSDTADIKQKRDRAKYDKAAKLERHIDKVRRKIMEGISSDDPKMREVALAWKKSIIYVIAGVVVVLAVAASLLVLPTLGPRRQAPSEIVVGAALPMSGSFSQIGLYFKNGFELYFDEVNSKGGVYVKEFDKRIPIKLIVLDDESDTTKSAAQLERLITVEKVHLILEGTLHRLSKHRHRLRRDTRCLT